MSIIDARKQAIIHWLKHTVNLKIISFEVASSDASFRRYFRVVHRDGQHIVMDSPPDKENNDAFIYVATLLKKQGINTPNIIQQDLSKGFLLLEDFGIYCFLDRLQNDNATTLYKSAFASLYKLQSLIDISRCQLPLYNATLLREELTLFYHWFLKQTLHLSIPEYITTPLNTLLITSALTQPQVCVHRDFHCRNLLVLTEKSPGVIDFQDAVIGPITYDLASLLRDCYVAWPRLQVEQWMAMYFRRISKAGLVNVSLATFTRWFDLIGLHRHLKAIGIFSRLHFRDQKSAYLNDIPRTLNYVRYVAVKYAELAPFSHYLTHTILPAYNRHKKQ